MFVNVWTINKGTLISHIRNCNAHFKIVFFFFLISFKPDTFGCSQVFSSWNIASSIAGMLSHKRRKFSSRSPALRSLLLMALTSSLCCTHIDTHWMLFHASLLRWSNGNGPSSGLICFKSSVLYVPLAQFKRSLSFLYSWDCQRMWSLCKHSIHKPVEEISVNNWTVAWRKSLASFSKFFTLWFKLQNEIGLISEKNQSIYLFFR